jgi:hypothetical protein
MHQRRHTTRTTTDRRPPQRTSSIAIQPNSVMQQQLPTTTHLNQIAQRCIAHHLTHRRAPEHQ